MDSIDTILFDWDGTLVDSASLAFEATQKSLGSLGYSLTIEQYEKAYSPDWNLIYEAIRLPRDKWEEANEGWLSHYGGEVSALVPGGRETLDELVKRNYCLGIVTGGSQSRVLHEIEAHGLAPIFKTVICCEDVIHRKPHPEGLDLAMQRIGKRPGACCYVGDSVHDIEMGKRARLRTIGVRSRYPGSDGLSNAGPDFYLEKITLLLGYFDPLR